MSPSDAGRVIAGTARGIRLRSPGAGTRPIGDRVKQTLFAILEPRVRDARVLDLFAGSGAAGIEALSRGARRVVFVERDRLAADAIATNLERTDLGGERASIVRAEVRGYLSDRAAADGPFDIVVVDPPYPQVDDLRTTLAALAAPPSGILAPDATVVVKHFWREVLPAHVGLLASARERRFGETSLTFYAALADVPGGSEAG